MVLNSKKDKIIEELQTLSNIGPKMAEKLLKRSRAVKGSAK